MMGRKRLPPPAAAFMESVRGVGYDTKTAVADLIDNSVTANAERITIRFIWDGQDSTVSILDDGHGMTAEQLDVAMTLGSRNPLLARSATDLGRFGLGLKTASLSQCSRLLLATKTAGKPVSLCVWDLRTVQATNDWVVEDDASPEEKVLIEALEKQECGTLVLWRRLDRLVGRADTHDEKARLGFQRTAREVEAHLAMTFHRFLEPPQPKPRLYMNGDTEEFRIRPWDPFCVANAATQILPESRRGSSLGSVEMQGFVLPHKDRFDDEEYQRAGGPAGWISQQGFYVYRNRRLLVPGSWLGLGRPRRWTRDEQHKLARLRLDLPNSFDSEWSIDIKKSKAQPPLSMQDWLTRNAEEVRREAKEVLVHRGARTAAYIKADFSPTWVAEAGRAPKYRINREHPVVAELFGAARSQKPAIERVLRLLETTIPVHRIWLDIADRPDMPAPTKQQLAADEVAKLAGDLLERLMAGQKLSRSSAIQRLRHIEPFDQYPEIIAALEA